MTTEDIKIKFNFTKNKNGDPHNKLKYPTYIMVGIRIKK